MCGVCLLRSFTPALALLAALAACQPAGPAPGKPGCIPVAVTVPPQAYFVERIGRDRVEVEVMIPPGYSHVDYPLSPGKMQALSRARLYVKVGHPGFEYEREQIDPFLARLPGIEVVDMSRGMDLIEEEESRGGHGEDHGHAGGDPHVWVAPETVSVAARNIAAAQIRVDPAHGDEYRANFRLFETEIAALDREIRARLSGHRGDKFMVYHPTWGYFARQYGLEQVAIEADGKEPSAGRLMELIDLARREGVKVIFVQSGFPRKSAQVIADATGGEVLSADPQERDWAANLRRVAIQLDEVLARDAGKTAHLRP